MTITAGDILRVVAIYAWTDGNIMQNVFNAVVTGGGSPWDDVDIVGDALDWLDTMYATISVDISDAVDGAEVRVYKYDAIDDDWDEVGSDDWTWNPSNGSDRTPTGVAALINCKTTDPDVNGKKYIGGYTEGSPVNGIWDTTTLTRLALWGAEWVQGFTGAVSGASWAPGVWSPTSTLFVAMSGAVLIPTIPAYQRRRKVGVGI